MPLMITIAVIVLWILTSKIIYNIEKNKTGYLIRQRQAPSKCPECGYEKWLFVTDWVRYPRRICEACNTKKLEAFWERQRDIKQNPFKARYIPLENGDYAIVENRDYDRINQYRWYKNKDGYAVMEDFWGERVSMHRLVKGLKYVKGYHVHHKNHNPLDNRRKNLMRTSAGRHYQIHNG